MKIEFRQSPWVDLSTGETPDQKTTQVTCTMTALLRAVPNGLTRRLIASNNVDAMAAIVERGEKDFREQLRAIRDELNARDLDT